MQILRHSQIAVTMDIYSEVPSEATQEALQRLGQSLDGQATAAPAAAQTAETAGSVGDPAADLGGRYWDRTSDLLGVNEALSR